MAIVIPSKNIYSVENTKIPENKVDKVEYSLKKPSIANEVRDVFSTDFTENLQPTDESLNYFASTTDYVEGSFSSHAIAFAGLSETYFLTDVIIPAKIKNGRIKKAFSGVDKDNVANISYNISYKPRHGYATVVVERDASTQKFSVKSIEKEDKPFDPEVGGYYPTFNENGDLYVKSEYKAESSLYAPVAKAEITRIDQSNNATAEIEYIADEDVFKIKNLKILSRVETIEVGFGSSVQVQQTSTLNGMYHEYLATRISISVKGEVVELQFEDEAKSFAFANPDSPLEIEGSNIYQTTNYYSSGGNTVSSSYYNGYNLVQQYRNGKETAVIRCSVSDYYDERGQKIISVDNQEQNMTFKIYDIVLPMTRNTEGEDVPMSYGLSGGKKTFKVLGKRIYFDGAVWQELYLQES